MSKYSNKLLLLNFLMLLFIGCKYQSQDLINTKLTIDKENNNGEFYSSKKLDELFVIKGYTYFEPDNVGTSFDNFYIKNIIVQDKSNKKSNYLLFFDNKDVLRDTLKIPIDQIYSLNVKFTNNKRGIAIGTFDKNSSYFKINKNVELNNNLKLKPLPLNTKIIDCPLPIELLSEENIGLEDHFVFGIQDQKPKNIRTIQKASDDFSPWKGNYYANFEISRIDGDFRIKYIIKILSIDDISITEKINDENNNIQDIFIESVSGDKIVIKSKSDMNLEYIVGKIKGEYYLMGSTIYLLNPPNDKYLLKK
jgi:hypothetical protein